MARRIDSLEKDIQAVTIEWLNTIPNITAWRQNRGAFLGLQTATTKRRFVRFGQSGQSDIGGIVAPRGVMLQIEIKRRGEVPTLDQLEWIGMVNRHGGMAFWCDSLDSCVTQLSAGFLERGLDWSKRWEVA